MVKIRFYYSDGKFRGGLFDTRKINRLNMKIWDGSPCLGYSEMLFDREDGYWMLLQLSDNPCISGPESDCFDSTSNAIILTPKEALRWFEKQAFDPPSYLIKQVNKRTKGYLDGNVCSLSNMKKSEPIKISYPSSECYATILTDRIEIIHVGVAPIKIPLKPRFIKILEKSYSYSLERQKINSQDEERQENIQSIINKKGIPLIITHDLIRNALEKPKRKNNANNKDISILRKMMTFSDGETIIGAYDMSSQQWKTNIAFKLQSSSDINIPRGQRH